jgi:hypothetical protein
MKTETILMIVLGCLVIIAGVMLFINCNKNTTSSSEKFIAPTQAYIRLPTPSTSSTLATPASSLLTNGNAELFDYIEHNPQKEHFYYTVDSTDKQSPYLDGSTDLSTTHPQAFLDGYFENIGAGSNQSFNAPSDSLLMAQGAARRDGDINGLIGEMDIVYHNLADVKGMNV